MYSICVLAHIGGHLHNTKSQILACNITKMLHSYGYAQLFYSVIISIKDAIFTVYTAMQQKPLQHKEISSAGFVFLWFKRHPSSVTLAKAMHVRAAQCCI